MTKSLDKIYIRDSPGHRLKLHICKHRTVYIGHITLLDHDKTITKIKSKHIQLLSTYNLGLQVL